ncbi:hypothetical protein Y032_0082g1528 [Ancylostoma ceylanicum]|uniref:Uncharacterized protein n=1 Tax=Ancylostoma ceylanicum TaxID=53326 RepID=A0A016TQM0_9BILA|nr:hypothetical protein Y032_0082g1528 [Ancylostoma ceylanicum]
MKSGFIQVLALPASGDVFTMPIDEIPEEQMDNPNQPPEAAFQEEVMESNIRLDPRDLQMIIQAVKSEPSHASHPCSSKAPTFKRKCFARQHEFDSSVIRKLYPLLDFEGVVIVISEVIRDLEVRNETLAIADSHPQVFEFLDVKEKSESLKATDLRLGEFVESVKKKEQEASRKRKAPPPQQPFRRR